MACEGELCGIHLILLVLTSIFGPGFLALGTVRIQQAKDAISPESFHFQNVDCRVNSTTWSDTGASRSWCSLELSIPYTSHLILITIELPSEELCSDQVNTTVACVYQPNNPINFETTIKFGDDLNSYHELQDNVGLDIWILIIGVIGGVGFLVHFGYMIRNIAKYGC